MHDAKKQKKLKMPIRRIMSNNLYMLNLIRKSSPGMMPITIITEIFAVIIQFSSTLILQYVLNGIGKGRTFEQLATTVLVWMIFAVLMTSARTLYNYRYYRVQMLEVKKNIHTMLYRKAGQVELGCYENPDYYDRMAKAIEECANRADEVIVTVKDILWLVLLICMNFTLVVTIDPVMLVFVVFPIIAGYLNVKFNKVNYEMNMKIKEENRRKDYSRRVFYLSDYAKEMRLTDMSFLMLSRFRESGKRIIGITKKHGVSLATLSYLVTELNEVAAALGATLYAVWQTLAVKRMGYGDCLVIANAIDQMMSWIQYSSTVMLKFQEHALYIENFREFLDYEPKIQSGTKELPEEGDLVLQDVSFKYEGAGDVVLKNLNMKFGAKEKVAIVGHNGAGKTTLVKLLLRLYDAEGCISYGGTNIREFAVSDYRDMFSAVMQDYHIFALSVAENVLMDERGGDTDALVMEALDKSGLKEKVETFSQGIDTLMTKEFDESGQMLSGGEQQKMAISHVYTKKNRFVILDEPSSALDPVAEYEMYDRMMEACKDCGVIFISHRLSSAVLADRIYLMENGRVIESGSHEQLMQKNGKYAEMFLTQASNYAEVANEN